MSHHTPDIPDPRGPGIAAVPVELTEAELNAVAGGLNPQPLPPGLRLNPEPLPW